MISWLSSDLVDRLINQHLSLRPLMLPRDIYKLLYQGVCGPEHNIPSEDSFKAFLAHEYQAVLPNRNLPLWESIHPKEELGRINLQPYKALLGSVDHLTTTCLETAQLTWGSKDLLMTVWYEFQSRIEVENAFHVDLHETMRLTELLVKHAFPPIHHSEQYQRIYQPAYRLVARQLLPNLNLEETDSSTN